jgi:hypothetical protein
VFYFVLLSRMRIGWFTDVPITRIIQRLLSAIVTRGKTFLSVPFCYAHPTLVLNIIRQAHTKFGPECANVFRHRLCQHLQFRRSPIWFSSHCHWCFHFKSNILADNGDMLVLRMCIGNETTFALKSNPACKINLVVGFNLRFKFVVR